MGRATFTLKNSISGPIKNAVMMVPTPTIVGISLIAPPPSRKMPAPASTHTRSVPMRQYWNGASFHLPARAMATAS